MNLLQCIDFEYYKLQLKRGLIEKEMLVLNTQNCTWKAKKYQNEFLYFCIISIFTIYLYSRSLSFIV